MAASTAQPAAILAALAVPSEKYRSGKRSSSSKSSARSSSARFLSDPPGEMGAWQGSGFFPLTQSPHITLMMCRLEWHLKSSSSSASLGLMYRHLDAMPLTLSLRNALVILLGFSTCLPAILSPPLPFSSSKACSSMESSCTIPVLRPSRACGYLRPRPSQHLWQWYSSGETSSSSSCVPGGRRPTQS